MAARSSSAPTQKGVGIVARVVLVLAAVVPTDELDRLYTGFGTLSGDLGKVAEAVTSFAFGRVHLYLLPGMWVARPGRRTGAPHPGTPTRPVNGRASVPVPGEELQPDRGQNSLLTRHDVRKVHVRELQADFLAADSRPDRGPGVDRLAVTRLQLEDKGHQFRLRLVDPEVKAPVRALQ